MTVCCVDIHSGSSLGYSLDSSVKESLKVLNQCLLKNDLSSFMRTNRQMQRLPFLFYDTLGVSGCGLSKRKYKMAKQLINVSISDCQNINYKLILKLNIGIIITQHHIES